MGGGVYDLRMDVGLPSGIQIATRFYIPKVAIIPSFMMNFGGKLDLILLFLSISAKPTDVEGKSAEK